jgi:hypothetical protein
MELTSNMCIGMIHGTKSILLMTQNRMILIESQNQIFFGINFRQCCSYLVYFGLSISYEIL